MKNVAVLRRFLGASLIISITVPMLYHMTLNYTRREHYGNLTAQVCKAVEPQVQMGVFRNPIEYAQGMMLRQGFDHTPEVVFFDHGQEITPPHKDRIDQFRTDCEFAGYPGVHMSIYYESAPFLNIRYVYLFLFAVPVFFIMFMAFRWLLDHFQRQVVDTVQLQIKNLLELDSVAVNTNTGTIGRLLELNIPLLGYLKRHIEGMEDRISKYSEKIAEQKKSEVLSDVAAQVAHDIVAPISILEEIIKNDSKSEDHGLLLEELSRMKALANKMLRQYRGEAVEIEKENFDLVALLKIIAAEAQMLGKGKCDVVAEVGAEPVMVYGVRAELSAAFSNIARNSVDAIDKEYGRIEISLKVSGESIFVTVKDNGCGISPDNIKRVFEKGVSIGKIGGNGLGLFQARTAIISMSGTFGLKSEDGTGTSVEITFLRAVDNEIEVQIGHDTHLVFIDDHQLIHEAWKIILPQKLPKDRLHFFFSAEDFRFWWSANRETEAIFFVDHDLSAGDGGTGLELIEAEGLSESAFLVTGRAGEDVIQDLTRQKAIRLINKSEMAFIRFRLNGAINVEIVLIDDARANRLAWEIQARRMNRKLATFASGDEFFRNAASFDLVTPIYVDYFFDGEIRGNAIAGKLVNAGFSNVFLATAFPREKIALPLGVRGIVGKKFPGVT